MCTIGCSQLAAWTTNRSLLVASFLSRKIDQFRLDPTQSCTLRRRCDRVSSMSSFHTRYLLQHIPVCDQPRLPCPACILSTTSVPDPSQPTIAMINYIHTPTVTNSSTRSSSASEIIYRRLWYSTARTLTAEVTRWLLISTNLNIRLKI